ncbi:MAG: hypothetical protein JNK60_11895 [Acidobacteria bacterium]|nr:hypothetical protein [Acidobacteriota bacterium]
MGWRSWLGLTPGRDEFARDLARRAAQRGVTGWTYDEAEAVLVHPERGKYFVGNSHLEYSAAHRSARPDLREKYLSMMVDPPPEVPKLWTMAAKNLYACLRSRHQMMTTEIECRGETPAFVKPVSRPWQGDLDVVLMYDFGHFMAQVMPETAETWGQSHDKLFEIGIGNLSALERPAWVPLGDGLFRIASEVSFDESFALVDEVIDGLEVAGQAVVALPNRGVLLAAGSESPAGLRKLVAEAQRSLQEQPWPLSGTLLRRAAGAWQPFAPPPELARDVRLLELLSLAGTYAEQQEALQRHLEKTGVDVFVAKFDLMGEKSEPGAVRSWCSWAEGVPSLLPKSDVVVLSRHGETEPGEAVIVPWEALERRCAVLLERLEEDPPRFRVDSFPVAEWPALKAEGERL